MGKYHNFHLQVQFLQLTLKTFIYSSLTHTPLYRVFQEECSILRESLPYVNLHPYNHTYICRKVNCYGEHDKRKSPFPPLPPIVSFHRGVIRTMHWSVLEPIAKPSQATHWAVSIWNPKENFYETSWGFSSSVPFILLTC